MALPQQKFREMVFQMLYSLDIGASKEEDLVALMMNELTATKKTCREGYLRAKKIWDNHESLDVIIGSSASSYSFERIHTVERNILRLALFEIIYDAQIPPKVAITEAIRLARKFSTPEAAAFVNAILDAHYQKQGNDEQPSPLL